MSAPFAAAVEALYAATPEPPPPESDPAEILLAAERAIELRAPLIELLHRISPDAGAVADDGVAERFAAILERDQRWAAAMNRAKSELTGRMMGVRRFRTAY